MALLALVREIGNRDPETVVELVVRNEREMRGEVVGWCEGTGNELLACEAGEEGELRCLVKKGEGVRKHEGGRKKMVVLVENANLESVVGVLDKAVAGAVLGMEVNVIFEGGGTRLLKRGYRSILSGVFGKWLTIRVERVLRRLGMVLPGEGLEILEELGASFWVEGQAMRDYGVREEEMVINSFEVIGAVGVVDFLGKSDVTIYSGGRFEKP